MPMSAAQRQKKYIEKLKTENPDKFEEKRKKHLERVKKKQKKTSELSESEKFARRLKWKEANEKRKQKKQLIQVEEKKAVIKQRRDIYALKRFLQLKAENIKLKLDNQKLKVRVDSLKKRLVTMKTRLRRTKKQANKFLEEKENNIFNKDVNSDKSQELMSPMSKANFFVKNEVQFVRDEDKEKVKRQVFELNVLSESLKQEYSNTKKNDEKTLLKKVVHNDLVKSYNLTGSLTSKLGLKGRIRSNKPNIQNEKESIRMIKDFYDRDDVSRATAGRKECKTKNKNKQQKRFLLDSMLNLFKKFVTEGGKCSYTTFTRHRPFYVVNPTINDRNTCACTKHSNLSLKADKLKSLLIIDNSNLKELVTQVSCSIDSKECMYNTCEMCKSRKAISTVCNGHDNITWFEWGLQNHSYVKKLKDGEKTLTTKKVVKDIINGTTSDLIEKFNKELISFKTHYFNIGHQHKALQYCIKNLTDDEVLIICDFSENYSCKLHEEIQSVHFGGNRNQISLHTGVIYSKNNKPASFCSMSPCTAHDPGAIWAHLSPVFEYAKQICTTLKSCHIFSDGPSTQYKQKKNFYLLNKFMADIKIENASWSFFEASHGKGAADGVGGAVKRTLDGFVSHGKDITNAEIAFKALKDTEKLVKVFYIHPEEIEKIQHQIPENLIALPGTKSVHQIVTNSKDFSLIYRDLSCFCGPKKACCQCYEPRIHKLISTPKPTNKNNIKKNRTFHKNKRQTESSDSENDDSDDIVYAESDDSTYCEDDDNDMIIECLDIEELNTERIKVKTITECMDIHDEKTGQVISVENKVQSINEYMDILGEKTVKDTESVVSKVQSMDLFYDKMSKMITGEVLDEYNGELAQTVTVDPEVDTNKEISVEVQKENETSVVINKTYESSPINKSESSMSTSKENETPKISILSEIEVDLILNEETGIMEIKPKEILKPKRGNYVLADFLSERQKIYRYVCVIEDVIGEKIVVKGLKSINKEKTIFKIIKGDISIVNIDEIVQYLPDPKIKNHHYFFQNSINVKEV